MALTGKVTDVLTDGYVEIMLSDDEKAFDDRHIAENPKSVKAKRGDIVVLEEAQPYSLKIARIAYAFPVAAFILGIIIPEGLGMAERIMAGLLLAVMCLVIAWLMNRKARLVSRLEYTIVRIQHRKNDFKPPL